jgi:hypothetical protein
MDSCKEIFGAQETLPLKNWCFSLRAAAEKIVPSSGRDLATATIKAITLTPNMWLLTSNFERHRPVSVSSIREEPE